MEASDQTAPGGSPGRMPPTSTQVDSIFALFLTISLNASSGSSVLEKSSIDSPDAFSTKSVYACTCARSDAARLSSAASPAYCTAFAGSNVGPEYPAANTRACDPGKRSSHEGAALRDPLVHTAPVGESCAVACPRTWSSAIDASAQTDAGSPRSPFSSTQVASMREFCSTRSVASLSMVAPPPVLMVSMPSTSTCEARERASFPRASSCAFLRASCGQKVGGL